MLRCRFLLIRLRLRQGKMMRAPSPTPILWLRQNSKIYLFRFSGSNTKNYATPSGSATLQKRLQTALKRSGNYYLQMWNILQYVFDFRICLQITCMISREEIPWLANDKMMLSDWLAHNFFGSQWLYRVSLFWTLRSSAEKYLLSLI
jgi:hypothetical protein